MNQLTTANPILQYLIWNNKAHGDERQQSMCETLPSFSQEWQMCSSCSRHSKSDVLSSLIKLRRLRTWRLYRVTLFPHTQWPLNSSMCHKPGTPMTIYTKCIALVRFISDVGKGIAVRFLSRTIYCPLAKWILFCWCLGAEQRQLRIEKIHTWTIAYNFSFTIMHLPLPLLLERV